MDKDLIAIYIPDEEAKQFLLFKEYQNKFCLLLEAGVFSIKNGSAMLNFDAFGSITTIQRADMLYNARVKKQ